MNRFIITLVASMSLILTSCLKDANNEQSISYNDASFSYEIELLEDDWYNEIRKYNEDNELIQTITYEYGTDTIIKRLFDENDEEFEVHYYLVDSNRLAKKSWDTLRTDTGVSEASRLTYVRDTSNGQLKRIEHTLKTIENNTVSSTSQFAYTFEFDDGDISLVNRISAERSCYDEYYVSDSVAVLDVYSFRQDKAFAFDGRITGEHSEHLIQGIVLSRNCYSAGYFPPEIAMAYELNPDKTVKSLTYLIFPARSSYTNNITADRIRHSFTYMDAP